MKKVFVYDPTTSDTQSAVRGIGRYLQILKENFPNWIFGDFPPNPYPLTPNSLFINPFFNFLQPPLTLTRIAQRQIAVIHDLIPLKYPTNFPAGIKGSIYILLNKLALKNYDLIITDSEASRKDIMDKLQVISYKIKVIYPCLPKSFLNYKPTPYTLPPTPYCLYVGDATWNKNLVNIAKAIKIANVNCVFVGKVFDQLKVASEEALREADCRDNRQSLAEEERHERLLNNTWNKDLKEFLKITKNDKRFTFPGFIPDQELIKLYQQARCNILISRDEGFGFSYLEASSQGCPSVLADIPVLREIAAQKTQENSLFVNQDSPNKIANAISRLFLNNDLRNKLGFEAQQRAEYFNQNIFIKKWQELTINFS